MTPEMMMVLALTEVLAKHAPSAVPLLAALLLDVEARVRAECDETLKATQALVLQRFKEGIEGGEMTGRAAGKRVYEAWLLERLTPSLCAMLFAPLSDRIVELAKARKTIDLIRHLRDEAIPHLDGHPVSLPFAKRIADYWIGVIPEPVPTPEAS